MMATGYRCALRSPRARAGVLAATGLLILLALGGSALAGEPGGQAAAAPPTVNSGDTAWVLMSAALVMLMTPGLAFFYGGLVRRKNMLSVLMQCFMILCLISLQWVVFGYSLAFGPDKGSVIGGLNWAFLQGVGATPNADYAATIPHQAFMIFQMMFAVITPALIIGAFAERMKFSALCIFTLLWATLVYDPVTHWVWGVGRLSEAVGRARLRGRHRGAHQRGHDRAGGGPGAGPPAGVSGRDFPAAQSAVCGPRGRAAVVRLVRLQRRQRPGLRAVWRPAPSWRRTSRERPPAWSGPCSTGRSTRSPPRWA